MNVERTPPTMLNNVTLLTLLGAAYLAVISLVLIVHPGAIVTALALPAVHGSVMSEVD